MLTTLEHLERHLHQQKKKSVLHVFWREIKIFSAIFVIVFVISSVTTNAQLYTEALGDLFQQFSGSVARTETWPLTTPSQKNTTTEKTLVDQNFLAKKMALDEIDIATQAMNTAKNTDFISRDIVDSNLKQNLDSYSMTFNTLPPTDRVIIPDIDVNVPLLQSSFADHIAKITKEDMDKDLYKWVVQYPTTPHAGEWGNTLIFWHTSYEARKHNPYATVFAKLPKLNKGQIMQVIQNGKLYEYEVIEKKIMAPSKVNEEYLKNTKWNYLTLLGCYPIGSDKQRLMVIGKLKE